jgi:hypothetical protein
MSARYFILLLLFLFIATWTSGCSSNLGESPTTTPSGNQLVTPYEHQRINTNGNLAVGETAHFQYFDSKIDITLNSAIQNNDTLRVNVKIANTGENDVTIKPEFVIKSDTQQRTWGYPAITVSREQKEFNSFTMNFDRDFTALFTSKGAQVNVNYQGQEAFWILSSQDLVLGSGSIYAPTNPDINSRKNDLSLQLLKPNDFSQPLLYYEIITPHNLGDEFKKFAYTETYLAMGIDNKTPFNFQEVIVRFPPGNASLMVEYYDKMAKIQDPHFADIKLPDLSIGDKGYAYRREGISYDIDLAFFSKQDLFILLTVTHPQEEGYKTFKEIAMKAEQNLVP